MTAKIIKMNTLTLLGRLRDKLYRKARKFELAENMEEFQKLREKAYKLTMRIYRIQIREGAKRPTNIRKS